MLTQTIKDHNVRPLLEKFALEAKTVKVDCREDFIPVIQGGQESLQEAIDHFLKSYRIHDTVQSLAVQNVQNGSQIRLIDRPSKSGEAKKEMKIFFRMEHYS